MCERENGSQPAGPQLSHCRLRISLLAQGFCHQVALPIKQGSAGIPVSEKLGLQSFPGWDHIKKSDSAWPSGYGLISLPIPLGGKKGLTRGTFSGVTEQSLLCGASFQD